MSENQNEPVGARVVTDDEDGVPPTPPTASQDDATTVRTSRRRTREEADLDTDLQDLVERYRAKRLKILRHMR